MKKLSGLGGSSRRERHRRPQTRGLRPRNEAQVFAAIGRRYLANQEKKQMANPVQAGATLMIQPDKIFSEIGKLHMQNQAQAENLQNMARAITDRDRKIAELQAEIAALKATAQPAGLRLVDDRMQLSPEEVQGMTEALEDPEVCEEEKQKIRAALQAQVAHDVSTAAEAANTKQPA
jgi:hypothetical protein